MSQLSHLKSVLVAEDDFLIATDIEQVLSAYGCSEVELVSTCEDALARVAGGSYDLVTVDLALGDGSCDRLVALLVERKIPFIYITGFSCHEHPNLPPAPWLSKPMAEDDILEAVMSVLPRA